jgi:hypothetical protein
VKYVKQYLFKGINCKSSLFIYVWVSRLRENIPAFLQSFRATALTVIKKEVRENGRFTIANMKGATVPLALVLQ